jgi:hypothetical protein
MKKMFFAFTYIILLATVLQAEVFTKAGQKIKYTLKTEKPVNFEFTFKSQKDSCGVEFWVYDEAKKLLMNDKYSMEKLKEVFNLPVKAGEYYMELGTFSNCLNKPFELGLSKVSGFFEQEPNDTSVTATVMQPLKYHYGYIQNFNGHGDDSDFYTITIDNKSFLKLVFKHKNFNEDWYWYVVLLDSNNNQLFKMESNLNTDGFEKEVQLDKGSYYVKVYTYMGAKNVKNKEYSLAYVAKAVE